jgi:uncharacterized protein involved in copper resistance
MNTNTIENLTRTWTHGTGILVDHLEQAQAAGATLRTTATRAWLVAGKAPAVLVACGEIVQAWDEDGPHTGRCGAPVAVWADGQMGTGCAAHDLGPEHLETCEHGMSKALCAGPGHYPMDR